MGKKLGYVALTVAVLAVLSAVLPRPVLKRVAEGRSVVEQVENVIDRAVERAKGEPDIESAALYDSIAVILGLAGLVAALVGWALRGNARICAAAAILAVVGITWQHLLALLD